MEKLQQFIARSTTQRFYARRIARIAAVVLVVVIIRVGMTRLLTPGDSVPRIAVQEGLSSQAALASAFDATVDDTRPTDPALADLQITAGLVKNIDTGASLFRYRANARWPLASLTKLLSAAVAMDSLGANTYVTLDTDAVATEGEAGRFKAGERYTVVDLVRAMLTVSSNDAAIALAQAYDRAKLGPDAYAAALNKTALFTTKMQEVARQIGMSETYIGDPSGLSLINQSTIDDLDALVRYITDSHPELLAMTQRKENIITERKSGQRRTLQNINQFAGQAHFVGGKTGFTDEANGNLISVFTIEGQRYLFIVLGTDDRFGATQQLLRWATGNVSFIQ